MSVAIFEFPLSEKVRNYLRLELLFNQLDATQTNDNQFQSLHFFDVLFTLLDLLERLDLRTDLIRDIDVHEKNLVHWSSHPNINTEALEHALAQLHKVLGELKKTKKLGSNFKDDRFLNSIKQRFVIAGGATSFDLPHLFCWMNQSTQTRQLLTSRWLGKLQLVRDATRLLLSFLREKSEFKGIQIENGFYQETVENKIDLVRVKYENNEGVYPILSGNKNRYGIKFMKLLADGTHNEPITETMYFELATS